MKLSPNNEDGINFVKSKCPEQINWSNICDYMTNTDFLKMAKLCSGDSTAHTCHFMNWPDQVYGTHLHDYFAKKQDIYDEIVGGQSNLIR